MATPQYALDPDLATTVLNAAAATGAGLAYAAPQRRGGAGLVSAYSWSTIITGSPSGISVTIQGSNDGSTWTTLDTSTSTSGETRVFSGSPAGFLRANLGTLTGGSSPTVTVKIQPGS